MNFLTRVMAKLAFDRISLHRMPHDSPYVAELVDQMESEFIAAPPLTLHLPVPHVLAGVWAALRESALAGPTDRRVREAIASAVSALNGCPFCLDAHTGAMSALGADAAAKAVRSGRLETIKEADIQAASAWAAATRSPGHPVLASPPFTPRDEPYAIGTALVFHYINRMVNAFLKSWVITIPPFIRRRGIMTRVNGVRPGQLLAVANLEPGSSLQFCQPAPRLPELAKLERAPAVGQAWAALAAAADAAGAEFLSSETRGLVVEELTAWDGSDPGLVSKWVSHRIAALHQEERAIATFALTCAIAPYRISSEMLAEVRKTKPTDAALISVAAWASARATRRIASWL